MFHLCKSMYIFATTFFCVFDIKSIADNNNNKIVTKLTSNFFYLKNAKKIIQIQKKMDKPNQLHHFQPTQYFELIFNATKIYIQNAYKTISTKPYPT